MNKLICVLFLMNFTAVAQDSEKLFKQNCGACHTIGKGKLVGPDLKGTHARYEEDWLMKWIKSSQSLVKKGDPTAVKLFEENNKLVMPDQTIPDADIKTILAFIKTESEKPAEVVSETKPEEKVTVHAPSEPYDYKAKEKTDLSWKAATFVLAGFCVLLVIVIVALANIVGGMAKTFNSSKADINQHSV